MISYENALTAWALSAVAFLIVGQLLATRLREENHVIFQNLKEPSMMNRFGAKLVAFAFSHESKRAEFVTLQHYLTAFRVATITLLLTTVAVLLL